MYDYHLNLIHCKLHIHVGDCYDFLLLTVMVGYVSYVNYYFLLLPDYPNFTVKKKNIQ